MYDIYLSTGCHHQKGLNTLTFPISVEKISPIKSLLFKENPGYLFLDLEKDVAKLFLHRLKICGARGLVIDSQYREPRIGRDQAFTIAEITIKQKQQNYPELHFEAIREIRGQNHPMWWTFGSVCQEWVNAGMTPGMVFSSIDKFDGHIWESGEMRRFHEEQDTIQQHE